MLRIAVELAALGGGAKDAQAYRYNNAAGITPSTSCTSIIRGLSPDGCPIMER